MKQMNIRFNKPLKKIISILLITLLSTFIYAQSQDFQSKKEKIEAQRIAFITKFLDLTPQEAQVFWPVYNQYQKEYNELRAKHKEQMSKRKNLSEMTDNEATDFVDSEIVYRQEDLDLQKRYHLKYKNVLPIRKVAKLYYAENQFKKELLKRIKEQNTSEK